MTSSRSQRRAEAHLLADLEAALRPAPRIRLTGLAWRWRQECALVAVAAAALAGLVRLLGAEWAVISVSALLGALGPWPPWHRVFIAAAWRLITPHRLHSGLVQARIQSRKGKVPVVLRTTSQPFGERMRVWCPAGTSAEDLESARAVLRAACWATDVLVTRDEQRSHLVTVDVIRWPVASGPLPGTLVP